jgi:hypothetical protein
MSSLEATLMFCALVGTFAPRLAFFVLMMTLILFKP